MGVSHGTCSETIMKHFNSAVFSSINNKKENSKLLTKEKYLELLNEVKKSKLKAVGKKPADYRRLKRYDILKVGECEKLIYPISAESPNISFYVHAEELFGIIHQTHLLMSHGGRDRMLKELRTKYRNVTTEAVVLYLSLCEYCQKRSKTSRMAVMDYVIK